MGGLQQLVEFVEETDAHEVSQSRMIKGRFFILWRSAHPEPYLTKS
jgi:hypothetical protein